MAKEKKQEESIIENPERNIMSDKARHIIVAVVAAVLVILIVVLALLGNGNEKTNGKESNSNSTVSSNSSNTTKSNATSTKNSGERNVSTDFLKSFYEAFDSKDVKVIFFARSSCGYCVLQKPILKQVAEDYDLDYFNIDTDELSSTEVQEIISALGIQGSTPNTVVVQKGKVLGTSNGYLDGKEYVKYLVKYGALKEGSTYKPEDNLKEINYSEFKKIAEQDKASLIYLDTTACSACINIRSLLSKYGDKNNFKVNYLSAYSLTQEDVEKLVNTDLDKMGYDDEEYVKDKAVSVPLLLVVKDNKIQDYLLKETDESEYKKLLEKYKFIK